MRLTNATGPFDANALRTIAESADGLRDSTFVLRIGDDGTLKLQKVDDVYTPTTGEIVVRTPSKIRDRKRPKDCYLIHPAGHPIPVDPKRFDAVFWSEAACEKFLIPYYVRFYDETEMAKLREAIDSPEVIAIGHTWPSPDLAIKDREPSLLLEGPQHGFLDGWVPLSEWQPNRDA